MSQRDWVFELVLFGVMLILTGVGMRVLSNLQCKRLKAAEQARGPERRIISRWPVEDEVVRLQCGHEIHLTVHRVQSLNCKECASVPIDASDASHSASPEATKK